MVEAGLAVTRDAFGNVIGRLAGRTRAARGLGRLSPRQRAGRRQVRRCARRRRRDPAVAAVGANARTLGVVAFRDEERGCYGSFALAQTGPLPGRYVELHVEQGPVLERAGAALGVVTAIVGSTGAKWCSRARPGTPARADGRALRRARAGLGVRAPRARRGEGDRGAVATVGVLEVEPGAVNVIPGRVRLTVDARAPDEERLARLLDALDLDPGVDLAPVQLDDSIRAVLREEIERVARPLQSSCRRVRGTTRACSPRRASRRGCSSSAASTAASASSPEEPSRARRTSRRRSRC